MIFQLLHIRSERWPHPWPLWCNPVVAALDECGHCHSEVVVCRCRTAIRFPPGNHYISEFIFFDKNFPIALSCSRVTMYSMSSSCSVRDGGRGSSCWVSTWEKKNTRQRKIFIFTRGRTDGRTCRCSPKKISSKRRSTVSLIGRCVSKQTMICRWMKRW